MVVMAPRSQRAPPPSSTKSELASRAGARDTHRVTGYGDFCPLARAAEVYATRWTPLIIRNMLMGCRTFTEIREGLPNVSRSVLSQRLRLLEHHGLVARDADGRYSLTEAGEGLEEVTH